MTHFKSILAALVFFYSQLTGAAVPQEQRDALVALYQSTQGENWINQFRWLEGDPCDEQWFGVVCSENSIVELQLGENNLAGSIPHEIGVLTDLNLLSLSRNKLYGEIPASIGNLSHLVSLYLYKNQLSGPLPESMTELTNLRSMYVSENELSGSLPDEISDLTSLRVLSIENNKLTGALPTTISQLENMFFFLYRNNALRSPNSEVANWLDYISCYTDMSGFGYECESQFQTLPPKEFMVSGDSSGYTLSWETTNYQQVGGFQIWVSEDENGPYRMLVQIDDKNATSYVTESLANSGSEHHFRIKSFTRPHEDNRNFIVSEARTQTGTIKDDSWYPMQSLHSGSWNNQDQGGHGLSIEILPGNVAVIYWYVFDNNGKPMWLVGAGAFDGKNVQANMSVPKGGMFPPEFDSNDINNQFWGTLNMSFTAKNELHLTWNPEQDLPFTPGDLTMQQFVRIHPQDTTMNTSSPQKNVAQISPTHSGSWFNTDQSGHGLVVETLANGTGLIYWYVFDNQGNQVWLVGSGNYDGNTLEVTMNSVTGARFPPLFDSNDITVTTWGTATLTFSSCNSGLFSWQPEASQTAYSSGQMSVQRLTQLAELICTE